MFSLSRYKRTFKKSLREIINKFDLIKMKIKILLFIKNIKIEIRTRKISIDITDICDMKHFIQICEKKFKL